MIVIRSDRPPHVGEPPEQSTHDALIEEARSRARRRRRIYGALCAVLIFGALAVVPDRGETSGRDGVPPRESDPPDLAAVPNRNDASSVVAEWGTYGEWMLLYGDGRVLHQIVGGHIAERHLSQAGWHALRVGDILLPDLVAGPNPATREATLWNDSSHLYVPDLVAICPSHVTQGIYDSVPADPTAVVGQLPADVQALLRGTERTFTDSRTLGNGLSYSVKCWAVASDQAATLRQRLAASPGIAWPSEQDGWSYKYSTSSTELVFGESTILPHGEWMHIGG